MRKRSIRKSNATEQTSPNFMTFSSRLTLAFIFLSWLLVSSHGVAEHANILGADHPLEERVNDLVSRMTLEEMSSQLVSRSPAIQRLGIPEFIWDNEGKHAFVSCFPVSIGIAATWNPALSERVASAISDEARATFNNLVKEGKTQRYLCFWAPTINMARDPRWGRTNETFGEDPYLTTQLALPFIRGLQGNDPKHLKVAAGINHYAVYSQEKDRHSVNATLKDERLLRDYYLPHFEACIKEGGSATVGATNNGLNGVPLCANHFMLTNILRQEWGFDGFVFSDSASVEDLYQTREYVPDAATAAAAAVGAGCDINTGLADTYLKYLPESVRRGLINKNVVVEACRRVMTIRFRLGLFDPPEEVPYSRIPDTVIDSKENRQLAREVAAESIVLLKNEDNILPLKPSTTKRILVTGPRADLPELGRKQTGSSEKNVSALEGIRRRGREAGIEVIHEKEPAASIRAAATSDVVLYFTSVMEGEVADRMNLDLPPLQEKQLLDLIATKTPVIVVFISGACVTSEQWIDRVPAALAAWYPGEEGGNAIADIVFGDVNPSGKLPVTFYRNKDQLRSFDEFDIRNGMTYQYIKTPAQWSFGYGLSYTTFSYLNLKIIPLTGKPGNYLVSADVMNSGTREGKEVAQLYLHAIDRSTGDAPLKQLKGFTKISLKPGETQTVRWQISPDLLAFHDTNMNFVVEPSQYEVKVGGSSTDTPLAGKFDFTKKVTLRRGAAFRYHDLRCDRATFNPDEPVELDVEAENIGQTTGMPQVLINGKPYPCETQALGPGEKRRVTVTVRLHQPGTNKLKLGDLPPLAIKVNSSPAKFVCSEMAPAATAVVGRPYPMVATIRNIGGSTGTTDQFITENGQLYESLKIKLSPGSLRTVTLNHQFNQPGVQSIGFGNLSARSVIVGNGIFSRNLRTFSNTRIADFQQASAKSFFITASGSIGGSWIEDNNGAMTKRDEYASIYLPGGAKRQCVVTVKITGLDRLSNHTKGGIMIRNQISAPGVSPGYMIFGTDGYFGGLAHVESDQDQDGYLDTTLIRDLPKFPKFLKLEKNGSIFRAFVSTNNGKTWIHIHTLRLSAAADVQDVGLFAASDMDECPTTACFEDFTIEDGLFSGEVIADVSSQPKPEQPY